MSGPGWANDGSFMEHWQQDNYGNTYQQQGYEQDPAQLASAPVAEEGELPGQQAFQYLQHRPGGDSNQHQYIYGGGRAGHSTDLHLGTDDADQRQLQEQYDAWPQQAHERDYAAAHQQAQTQQYKQVAAPDASASAYQQFEASLAKEKKFNACDAWFGPWPGFCFKLVGVDATGQAPSGN